jgi:hypothetical protein
MLTAQGSKDAHLRQTQRSGDRLLNPLSLASRALVVVRLRQPLVSLGPRAGDGFPDGIAFDRYGNLWGTITAGERIFAITPEGGLRIIYDDRDEQAWRRIDAEFFAGKLMQETLFSGLSSVAPATASVNFGGPRLDTVYVGSLFETRIPYFTAPVAGEPPVWWPSIAG